MSAGRGPRVRLFAALDVPEAVREELASWAARVGGPIERLRLLAPESLHVTLAFLGWRGEEEAGPIGALVADCARPVPALALGGAAWLPPRRARVLAAEVGDRDGALAALQASVSEALAEHAGYEPERRAYRPHVTVARARGELRRPPDVEPPAPLEFDGAAVTLYRSRLGRGGARYEPVARTAL